MTFEEKWNHVARRLFVFFTREGVFNFSLLLLSPLGRVDFASNASKRRERFLFLKRLRAFILLALQTSIVLTSISFRQATSPRRRTPPLRQPSSATFAYAADAPLLSLCDIFPVSSGTFTRFIGRACPKGESKEWRFARFIGRACPEGKARDRYLPVSSGEPAPKGKARNGDSPVLSGEFISNVKASLEK